ncbi:MAG TPA: hypothetical protein VFG43_16035 [Geminicoccaceae bacterium]|nr:hypothetical protein [Geminicoccaceae bacterium]
MAASNPAAGPSCGLLRCLLAPVAAGMVLAACTGGGRLATAVTSLNKEIAQLQDQAVLLNILRRSRSQPIHFSTLSIVRGRSRISAGANLNIPFGRAARRGGSG